MSENELKFYERWDLIKKSVIFGGILSAALSLFISIKMNGTDMPYLIEDFFYLLVLFWIAASPTVSIIIMMVKKSNIGFAGKVVIGFRDALIGSISANPLILALGLLKIMFYSIIVGIIGAIYIIYLPVSTIVYYVRYKKEKNEGVEIVTNIENNID